MKISKSIIVFLPLVLVLAAIYPLLNRHPVSLFVLKGSENSVEAFKVSAPLNGRDVVVESVPLSPEQRKEGGEILGQKDCQRLVAFSKNYGAYSAVVGIPVTQESWPGFLGGGLKGFFIDSVPDVFDNLQWSDRFYLSLSIKTPPPAPFTVGEEVAMNLPVATPGVPAPRPPATPSSLPTPGVVRVEILNGCGITNAADWVARRVKGPGILIADTDNAENFRYPQTIIRTCAGMPVALEEAVERLGLSKDSIQEVPSLSTAVDAVVIVGKDFPKLRGRFRERNRH